MISTPDTSAAAVHLASLLALFFSSVAKTAPRWVSSLCLQSTPAPRDRLLCQLSALHFQPGVSQHPVANFMMELNKSSIHISVIATIPSPPLPRPAPFNPTIPFKALRSACICSEPAFYRVTAPCRERKNRDMLQPRRIAHHSMHMQSEHIAPT